MTLDSSDKVHIVVLNHHFKNDKRGEKTMHFKGSEYKEFYDIEELKSWETCKFNEEYAPLRGTLFASPSPAGIAIQQYAGYLYRPMNYYARRSTAAHILCAEEKIAKDMEAITEFMYSTPISENVVAYRFISQNGWRLLRDATKQEYGFWRGRHFLLEKGFMSTTLLPKEFLGAYNCAYTAKDSICIKILVPKESFGIFVTLIAGRPQEAELLLAPYSCLRIINVKTNEILCKLENQSLVTTEFDRTVNSYLFNR